MITKNAPFIKALRKLFLEYGVEITQYGNHADESLAFFFTGDEVDVLIEQGIFEGCDLTPDPVPAPPPPPEPTVVEKLVIHKIDCSEASDEALRKIAELSRGVKIGQYNDRINAIRTCADAAIRRNKDEYVPRKYRDVKKIEHVLS